LCGLSSKKQKEWAAALGGQTTDLAGVEAEVVSGGEFGRPGAGRGREGDGTDEKKGEKPFEGMGVG